MRAPVAPVHAHMGQQRDRLDGFAKPHLVGQDPVEAPLVERHQPVQPDVLVLAERVLQQRWNLAVGLPIDRTKKDY